MLLRTIWLSLDPYMRGRMSDGPSYAQPVPIGGVMEAGTVNEVRALRSLSLTLHDGELVTVVGSNGAGKSSLLNTLAGVGLPDRGKVFIADQDVTRMVEHKRARFVGRVFQNPLDGTAAGMTVEENLALAARHLFGGVYYRM